MKRASFRFFTLLLIGFTISCDNNYLVQAPNTRTLAANFLADKNPDQIGPKVFDIIKDFNKKSLNYYQSELLKAQELNVISTESSTQSSQIELYEQLQIARSQEYKKIQSGGYEYGIDWNKVTYINFIYELDSYNKSSICKGKTFFEFAGQVYYTKSLSIFVNGEYQLYGVDGVYKEGDKQPSQKESQPQFSYRT